MEYLPKERIITLSKDYYIYIPSLLIYKISIYNIDEILDLKCIINKSENISIIELRNQSIIESIRIYNY